MSRWLGMRADALEDICYQLDDLIEGYALGSLETSELLFVSDNINRCPETSERLRTYEEAVGLLGLAVPATEPRPDVWARLEGSTHDQVQPQNVTTFPVTKKRGVTLPRWAAALASAAALFLVAATISLGVALQQAGDDDSSNSEEIVAEYLMSGGEMMQLKSWAAPEYLTWPPRGTLITAPNMPPIVIVDKCVPTEGAEFDYVVWLQAGDERTSMGIMEVSEDGKGILQLEGIDSLENYDAIGISIQKPDSTVYDVMEGWPKQDA